MRSFTQLSSGGGSVDPERRNAVLLIGGISLIVAFALALIAYGYYADRIAPRYDAVLRVGDRTYNYAFLERRIKSDYAQGLFNTQEVGDSISASISRIQREELIRIIARERGVTASDDDVLEGLRTTLGLGPEADRNLIASRLRDQVLRVRLSLDEYLEIVEASVLETKIKQQFTDQLPAEAEQVDLLLIAAGSQSNAIAARDALAGGAPFEVVAQQFSSDATAQTGGVFGWAPRELLGPELADAAFNLTGRSGIIETEEDFYIIEVLDKQVMPISDDAKSEIGEREMLQLLQTKVDEVPFAADLSEEQLIRLANSVGAGVSG